MQKYNKIERNIDRVDFNLLEAKKNMSYKYKKEIDRRHFNAILSQMD